jgi:hypothetical protein
MASQHKKFNDIWMTTKEAGFQASKYQTLGLEIPPADDVPEVPRKKYEILTYPYDIRAKIYDEVVGFPRIAVFLPGCNNRRRTAIDLERGIMQAGDRQLRQEALLTTLKNATFEIHSGPGNARFQAWLSRLKFDKVKDSNLKNGLAAVHTLKFPYFSRFPFKYEPYLDKPNNDIELMRRCPNLQKVQLDFVPVELIGGGGYAKGIDQLRKELRLDEMRCLLDLKVVQMWGVSPDRPAYGAVETMAKWFKAVYAERGKVLKVLINDREAGT